MRSAAIVFLLVSVCLLSPGCTSYQPPNAGAGKPTLTAGTGNEAHTTPSSPAEWVASDNGDLSLRLRVKSTRIAAKDSIFVIAEIRNNRSGPVTILRPCGDYYSAVAGQIKIWNQDQQIKYTGPKYDYELTAEAFVTLEANKIVTDTLELPVRNFAGSDKAGAYLVRYDYTYSGDWDDTVAKKGVKGIWHGAMCSREVSLQKE